MEEKIKLCEGKYDMGLCESAFDVWTAEMLLSKSGGLQANESPCLFLPQLGSSTSAGVRCSGHLVKRFSHLAGYFEGICHALDSVMQFPLICLRHFLVDLCHVVCWDCSRQESFPLGRC